MTLETPPPTLDPVAVARWQGIAAPDAPWLHEEVARRMAERLQWIRLQPKAWAHWEAQQGGLQAQADLQKLFPNAVCYSVQTQQTRAQAAIKSGAEKPNTVPWWTAARWLPNSSSAKLLHTLPPPASVDMLWANMALHTAPAPQALMRQWQAALTTGGFLMFSCLGPDSLRSLRNLYVSQGWPPPAHELTDMHDWGDMLVQAGFAEPVMDMERITLSFDSPERLLKELAGLGRNFHKARFAGLRGRAWLSDLRKAIAAQLQAADGRFALEFEIIYGHALRAAPKVKLNPVSTVPLSEMRQMLMQNKKPAG